MPVEVKTLVAIFFAATVFCYGQDSEVIERRIPPNTKSPETTPINKTTPHGGLFAYALVGGTLFATKADPSYQSMYRPGVLDDRGYIGEVGFGYRGDNNIFGTISWHRAALELVHADDLLLSLNYEQNISNLFVFGGIVAGYSSVEWSKAPDKVDANKKLEYGTFAWGIQAGERFVFDDHLSIVLRYQYLNHKHLINIYDKKQKITHNKSQTIMLGLEYLF